ncbi:MAG: GNAT family N-acetyltransferase [Dysgonamonadaceae bacterium]|jgi:predicted acetyltransferase|nr:GNAT family N-acetyltransferase [Dysgonamonadaceae bacterium]
MIRYADASSEPAVRTMWKLCFNDSDAFMELYFREKYRPDSTLIYYHEGIAAASLQMLPFRFRFWGKEIPVVYLSGLCTLPDFRKRGFMGRLIRKSFDEMGRNGIALAVLVPQDKAVMRYYETFGFARTFDDGVPQPSLKELMLNCRGDLEAAYRTFDAHYRHRDMTVQKTLADFRSIVEDAALSGFPEKTSLTGMSRIIDAEKLTSIFAGANVGLPFSISVRDEILSQNNRIFSVEKGKIGKTGGENNPDLTVDVQELAQLLLGYRTSEKRSAYHSLFPEKKTLICFMME